MCCFLRCVVSFCGIYIYIHTHTHTHTKIYIYIYMCVCVCVCVCVYLVNQTIWSILVRGISLTMWSWQPATHINLALNSCIMNPRRYITRPLWSICIYTVSQLFIYNCNCLFVYLSIYHSIVLSIVLSLSLFAQIISTCRLRVFSSPCCRWFLTSIPKWEFLSHRPLAQSFSTAQART